MSNSFWYKRVANVSCAVSHKGMLHRSEEMTTAFPFCLTIVQVQVALIYMQTKQQQQNPAAVWKGRPI